jgi:hypothetical protein
MKLPIQKNGSFNCALTLAALFALCPLARADWGSVRANNRTVAGGHYEAEHRHVDIEHERAHAFYWSRYSAGMNVAVLPQGYVQVSVGPVGYYYFDGVYYQATTEGNYVVVAPPVGVIVPTVPTGAETMVVGPTTYYYAGGACYLQQPNGFAVVQPPLGMTVPTLPPGAGTTVINGVLYYVVGNVYYQPIMQGGVTVYVTARP